MRIFLLTATLLLTLSSCRKPSLRGDYFIFGVGYGECNSECVNYYMVKKGRLYPDNMKHPSSKLTFENGSLPSEKYDLAKQLQNKIPDLLQNSPSTHFGCPDCRDQGAFFIEISENSEQRTFRIDTDTTQIPADIRPFVAELRTTLDQL